MSGENGPTKKPETTSRPVGNTENSWCRNISGGTGVAALTLQMSKPVDIPVLQNRLRKLQTAHPILRSKIQYNPSKKFFTLITPPEPHIEVQSFDPSTTSDILKKLSEKCEEGFPLSPLHLLQEHELNLNAWPCPNEYPKEGVNVAFASVYELPGPKLWVIALRLHTGICDRTTGATLLRELMELDMDDTKAAAGGFGGGGVAKHAEEMGKGIEDLIPKGQCKKTVWAHGLDVLEYSVNSFRLTNLRFQDAKSPRSTAVARLQMNQHETSQIVAGCKLRGIKLCGALSAAALMAAQGSRSEPEQRKKYGVLTLTDCRSILDPMLSPHNFGFYHAAVLNSHSVKGGDEFWDLATKTYSAFDGAKKDNKHFSDMADLNFLLCRALENPSLTPSSSLRTSLISVFEDPVIDNSGQSQAEVGADDYLGCASMHGVGPSVALFDTIRDGKLDCLCVYPTPLHSRAQMEELVQKMKTLLINAAY